MLLLRFLLLRKVAGLGWKAGATGAERVSQCGGMARGVRVVGCDGGREGSAGHRVEESSAVVPEWGRGSDETHALGRLAPMGWSPCRSDGDNEAGKC
jgi:hypothetical protein